MENVITFYYAVGSRYAYLASTQIDALAERHACTVNWKPVEGFELRALNASDPFRGATPSGQYQSPFRENDILDWARYYDVPYQEPASNNGELWWINYDFRPVARAAAAGFLLNQTARVSKALYAIMFTTRALPIDESDCIDCVVRAGIDRKAYVDALSQPEVDQTLSRLATQAAKRGVFGVPSFLIDDKLFFGNDRLVLLDHYLRHR